MSHDRPLNDRAFNEEHYWTTRLEETFSLGGCRTALGLSEPFNRWMYRVRRRLFLPAAASVVFQADARVLDVGSGTGFYVDLGHTLGVDKVTGSDLTRVAVDRLSVRYPNDRFVQLDITAGLEGVEAGHFDAASAMDVLFHVVDDGGYRRAIEHLAHLLAPGGATYSLRTSFTATVCAHPTKSAATLVGFGHASKRTSSM